MGRTHTGVWPTLAATGVPWKRSANCCSRWPKMLPTAGIEGQEPSHEHDELAIGQQRRRVLLEEAAFVVQPAPEAVALQVITAAHARSEPSVEAMAVAGRVKPE